MEPEEMKNLWSEMSAEREQQKLLTDQLIFTMTKNKYQSKLKKIWMPEIIGTIVSLAAVLYILMEFQKFNNWYLEASAIISVVILVVLSILSIRSVQRLRSVNISQISFRESLSAYAQRKKEFISVQKLSFVLGALLLVVVLPVMGRLIGGKDLFANSCLWIWYSIGFIFFSFCARYVFRHYLKTASEAENIFKELDIK